MSDLEPDMIEDGLWLGPAMRDPGDFAVLAGLGITDILTLQTEDEAAYVGLRPEVQFRLTLQHGMRLHRVPVEDFSPKDLARNLEAAVARLLDLRSKGRTVYVHCAAGVQRSPTVVAAYLVKSRSITPQEACKTVSDLHPSSPSIMVIQAGFEI